MTNADTLDRHLAETADAARIAMAETLQALHDTCLKLPAGEAVRSAGAMRAAVERMERAMSASQLLLTGGDEDSAALECAKAMTLADYVTRLSRLRRIASQIEAQSEAQSGKLS